MKILECVWSFEMYKIGQISCRANLSVRGGKAAVRKGELVDPTHALLIPGFRIQSPQNLVWVPRAAAYSIWGSPVQLTSLFPITSPKLWISTQVLEVPLFWATPCLNTRWEAVGTEWKVIPPGEVAWSLGKHSMTDLVWGSFGHQPILSHGRLRAVPCRSQAKCPISSVSKYFLEGHILRGAGKSLFRRLFPLHVFNLSEGREASGDTGEVMLRREGKKKSSFFLCVSCWRLVVCVICFSLLCWLWHPGRGPRASGPRSRHLPLTCCLSLPSSPGHRAQRGSREWRGEAGSHHALETPQVQALLLLVPDG